MNYEQKYKEALEKARQLIAYPTTKTFISDLQDLFPELKESEDEKIRKEILSFCQDRKAKYFNDPKYVNIDKWIAWLEKQAPNAPKDYTSIDPHFGKPINKVEPKFKVGDFIANDYCRGKVVELTNDAYLLDTGQGIPFSYEHNVHLWTIQETKDHMIDKACKWLEENADDYGDIDLSHNFDSEQMVKSFRKAMEE